MEKKQVINLQTCTWKFRLWKILYANFKRINGGFSYLAILGLILHNNATEYLTS